MGRVNWRFLGFLSLAIWVPLATWILDIDPRLVGSGLGFAAFMACTWQFIVHYRDSPAVARAALVLILLSLLLGAIAQVQLVRSHVDATVVTYLIIGHRVLCLLLALRWEKLLEMGVHTPWTRAAKAPEAHREPPRDDEPPSPGVSGRPNP
jgi:uncharacterized membrane protein